MPSDQKTFLWVIGITAVAALAIGLTAAAQGKEPVLGLKNAGVPVEMHLYWQGGHAFGHQRNDFAVVSAYCTSGGGAERKKHYQGETHQSACH